ncbi:hypothetical protein [Paracraurococcus lichenis]|uniref:Iron-containing redox enzyme family protein n=1 Tax=Paracraurococcus lichenis TaxID=3064888 RepID=A0ABT9E9K0_9PROT|nr:hypothetical protein [Paracraurococcus sp. LOR1-02]MDO9712877.1 hypothetical protein [Paracraurococcus sp. LOR1-02]
MSETLQTTLAPYRWSAAIEAEIFRDVAERHAPHLAGERSVSRQAAETPEEFARIADHWLWTAGHDSFIVQAATKAGATLFPQLDAQYVLARQIGDDGFHAEFARDYARHHLGHDPIGRIEEVVALHWAALEDLPYRDLYGFFAFELHYELHILARLAHERLTATLYDPPIRSFGEERAAPDEEVHRLRLMDWWLGYYRGLSPEGRVEAAERLLAADEEVQRRLNPYLNTRYERSAANLGTDIIAAVPIYDDFRREVLSRLLDIPAERLGPLTNLAD